jgi:1,4-dihydroxy-2-naphthoate octaprenyltransferase
MKILRRWIIALKIASWPKLLIPFLWGQSLGFYYNHEFKIDFFLIGCIFTFFLIATIVLLNDFFDERVDAIKRRLYPNAGSLKTIPDGILGKKSILGAGILSSIIVLCLSIYLELFLFRKFSVIMTVVCLLIFLLYSAPPLRLNYIGGGEFLEMIGVGILLPFLHYYFQTGDFDLDSNSYGLFASFLFFSLASAIASGLSDEVSDRVGGKTTIVGTLGNKNSRRIIIFLSIIASIFLAGSAFYSSYSIHWFGKILFSSFLGYELIRLIDSYSLAKTDEFFYIQKFKNYLHYLIWGNFLLVSVFFILSTLERNQ